MALAALGGRWSGGFASRLLVVVLPRRTDDQALIRANCPFSGGLAVFYAAARAMEFVLVTTSAVVRSCGRAVAEEMTEPDRTSLKLHERANCISS
ncbi:hypothetical protein [Aurantimonas coralicida]|uniref:hypothetical protein n=1 Tax=Aurantimonas coralicida TaxID=182270 RepID=UPI001D18B496|nr:hypothetical protein [Aurantimonas coralicida]MCC4296503.1 hypothetical protein [Aurantimonas coralicida]